MNCLARTTTATTATTNGCNALNAAFLATNGSNVKSVLGTGNASSNNNNNSKAHLSYATNSNSNNNNSHAPLLNNKPCPLPTAMQQQTLTTTATTTTQDKCKNIDLAAKIIRDTNIVCFDVDSTVIREEGIDELADFCGKGSEVARVTKEAMGGAMTFQDALNIRLNIIRPTQQQIADFIRQRPSTLTRNVKRFIEQLKADGKQVFLISGGFDCLIEPVANELNVPLTNLYANKLMFDYKGNYLAFDTAQPTSKSGGKAEAISIIKRQQPAQALITMIGDGATDLEAVPPANYFIGFGGNVVRQEVQKRAQYYVTDFEQLMTN